MRYMVIERFKPECIQQVYKRFDERGRLMPPGLHYLDSWITADLRTCYQIMEADDVTVFQQWTRMWDDLVEFEIVPVLSSSEARIAAMTQPQL